MTDCAIFCLSEKLLYPMCSDGLTKGGSGPGSKEGHYLAFQARLGSRSKE